MSAITAPAVTVCPLPQDWIYPGDPAEHTGNASAFIYVVLDVERAELGTLVRRASEGYGGIPGDHRSWVKLPGRRGEASFDFIAVPRRMSWITRLRTAEEINALLVQLAPLAEVICRETVPVPGTEDRDWSPAAAQAADELRFRAEYPTGVPVANEQGEPVDEQARQHRGLYVTAEQVYAACPELIQRGWAGADDRDLNDQAETHLRFALHWHPELHDRLGLPYDERGERRYAHMVGVRAWLYGYRQRQAGSLTVQSAEGWYARPEHAAGVDADTTDEQLATLAAAAEAAALEQGLRLVGGADVVRRARDAARERVRAELREAGQSFTQAKAAADRAQRRRAALLARVIAWEIEADTDTALGKLASMSHTGVGKLRAKLTDPEGDAAEE